MSTLHPDPQAYGPGPLTLSSSLHSFKPVRAYPSPVNHTGEGSAVMPISEMRQVSPAVKGMVVKQINELVKKGLEPGEVRPAQMVLCGELCSGYSC